MSQGAIDTVIESSRQEAACMHCGLPMASSEATSGFCCSGCESAYTLIRAEGLDQYYDLLRRLGGDSKPVDGRLSGESFVDLDAPGFWSQHVIPLLEGRVQTVLRLQGIHCAACVWLLERLPQMVPGVLDARVDLHRSTIEIVWNPAQVALSTAAKQLAKLGYRVVPLGSSSRERLQRKQERQQLIQIAIAGACSGNVMLIALALYAGEWTGMAAEHLQLLRYANTAIGLVSLLGPGSIFFRGAYHALRWRTPHMDLPIALGLGVGAASGLWNTLSGSGELYFDSLSMLVFLLLVGRALQSRQQQAACEAVDVLRQLTPGTVQRVSHGRVESIALESVQVGDLLEVEAEQTIPVDGVVVEGVSEVDTSLLTGESIPLTVRPGDEITAGTLNRSQRLRVETRKVGNATRIGHLAESIQRAALEKAPIMQWSDRISGIFVMVVLTLSVIVGATWYWLDRDVWDDRVVALLIVACPCALGLATPLAIAVGLGRSAKRGVLIKGGDALQRLSRPGLIVLDKTGTVTEGRMSIHEWHGDLASLEWAAAVESKSRHPIAEAVRQYWSKRTHGEPTRAASEVTSYIGHGMSGRIEKNEIDVGNDGFMVSRGCYISEEQRALHDQFLTSGQTPLYVACNRKVHAVASLDDSLRPEARKVLQRLERRGWTFRMLSGDHEQIALRVGKELGLKESQIRGGVTPEGKLQAIQEWKKSGIPIVMVGDGVNDAAALAAADVGIAIRGGAEASLQAADVFLANGSLEGIESIIETAQRTMRVIGRNSVASLLYNIFAVTTAALGWLHP